MILSPFSDTAVQEFTVLGAGRMIADEGTLPNLGGGRKAGCRAAVPAVVRNVSIGANSPEAMRLDEDSSMMGSRFMLPKQARTVVPAIVLLCLGCHSNATHGYKDDPQLTPLMNAAWHNDLPRVRTLLAQGADVRAKTAQGQTALYEGIERTDLNADNLPIVDALLKAGADPNEAEFSTSNPLSVSLTRDYANPAVTLRLLQAGAHVPQECPQPDSEDSLLSLATQESSLEVMRALIERGSPVNCQLKGDSALYWAALNGKYDRVALLLKSGAEARQQDLEAANTTNPDSRVQGDFAKTRQLLTDALKLRESRPR